jgi:1-deoxy-D-xylulose-5-phosphate reductoisomerase
MRRLTLLGSTGSIGVSTLDVVRRLRDQWQVHALVAGRSVSSLASQIAEFRPALAVVADEAAREELIHELRQRHLAPAEWPELGYGPHAIVKAATAAEVDFVVSAIVGVTGLEATYRAIEAKKNIGLANKEVLVACGELVMAAARRNGVELLPIDSEHNGVHQCLRGNQRCEAVRVMLTASGGPFRTLPLDQFESITPAQALKHPTWKMGPRITIDSATMMNKGFEVIEAAWLFHFAADEIDVLVHPQSTVHAMVEYRDGSLMAQACATDMRMPIQYALTWPERLAAPVPRLDWTAQRSWEFLPPDLTRFPLLRVAYQALRAGGSAGCVLNAADEVAVEAFLKEQISFPGIARIVQETMQQVGNAAAASVDAMLEMDRKARETAERLVKAAPVSVATKN